MPKLSYYQKKEETTPLEKVTNLTAQKRILETVRAIETHLALSCIAMGMIQILSFRFSGSVTSQEICYLRTPSKGRLSEATIMYYLRQHIFRLMAENPELHITQLIHEKQKESEIYWDSQAS